MSSVGQTNATRSSTQFFKNYTMSLIPHGETTIFFAGRYSKEPGTVSQSQLILMLLYSPCISKLLPHLAGKVILLVCFCSYFFWNLSFCPFISPRVFTSQSILTCKFLHSLTQLLKIFGRGWGESWSMLAGCSSDTDSWCYPCVCS